LLSTGAGRVRSSASLIFDTGGATERMRIDSSGNVGIGTTSPDEALEVNGDLKISGSSFGIVQFGETSDQTKIVGRDSSHASLPNTMDFFTSSAHVARLDIDGLHFQRADGQKISAKESLVMQVDADNNTASRVFQVSHGNGKVLLNLHDDYRGDYGTIQHSATRTAGYGQSNGLGASAGDWVDVATVPYGRNIATIKLFWDGIHAPSSSHHGNMEFDIGSHYGTSYYYGWDSYINLKASSAHNGFSIREARIITPNGAGATGYFQVKFDRATSTNGVFYSYVTFRDEACSIDPINPAVNNSRSGTTIASIDLQTRPSLATSRDFTSKGTVYGNTFIGTGAARAFCNWNGEGTVSIRDDLNVTSVTDMGVGRYRVNFSTVMSISAHTTVSTAGSDITDYASQSNSHDHNSFQGASTTGNIPVFAVDHDDGVQTDASYMTMITMV